LSAPLFLYREALAGLLAKYLARRRVIDEDDLGDGRTRGDETARPAVSAPSCQSRLS
jgi:hypothetical protein